MVWVILEAGNVGQGPWWPPVKATRRHGAGKEPTADSTGADAATSLPPVVSGEGAVGYVEAGFSQKQALNQGLEFK